MLRFLTPLLLALSQLTRFPIPDIKINRQAKQVGRATLFYPLVGLVMGLLLFVTAWMLSFSSSQHTLLVASMIIVLWMLISGGIHLMGLANSAENELGGLGDYESPQSGTKGSYRGTAGIMAIIGLVLLKVTALDALLQRQFLIALLVSPIIGRGMILLLFLTTPYIRKEGATNDTTNFMNKNGALIMVTLVFILGFIVSIPAMLAVLFIFYLMRRRMMKHHKGCTSDTVGATVEITEMMWLAAVALY